MGKQRKTDVVDDKPERLDVGDIVDKRTGNPDPFPKDVIKGSDLFDVEPATNDDIKVDGDGDDTDVKADEPDTSEPKPINDEGPVDIFDLVSVQDDKSQPDSPTDKTEEMLEMLKQRDEYIKQLSDALTNLQKPKQLQLQDTQDVDDALFEGILDPDVRERVKRQYIEQQKTLKRLEQELVTLKNIALQTSVQQQTESARMYVYGLTKKLVNKEGIIPELQTSIKRMIDGALYAFANGMPEAQAIFKDKRTLHNWINTVVEEHKKLQDQVKARLAGGIKTREEAPAIGGGGTTKSKGKRLPQSFDEARKYLAEQLRELNEQQ